MCPEVANAFLHKYCKCPINLYNKVIDKMAYANSADPDQTAPEGSMQFATKYLKK